MFKKTVLVALTMMLFATTPATAAVPALDWSGPRFVASDAIVDVDCPTTNFCAAIDISGNVIMTSNPTGSESDWEAVDVTTSSPRAISCSSPSLCIAVGANGEVATSTTPLAGAGAWRTTKISGANLFVAVDCAVGVCAALDAEGQIFLSDNPTDSVASWAIAKPFGNQLVLSAIDCPSSQLCVAVGGENRNLGGGSFSQENFVLTIEDPVGPGRYAEKRYLGPRNGLRAVSCSSSSSCVAVDELGEAWFMGPLIGALKADSSFPIHPPGLLADVSCPTSTFCAAVDENDQALTSTRPSGGSEAWAATPIPAGLESISCPSAAFCVAGGLNSLSVGVPRPPVRRVEPPTVPSPAPQAIPQIPRPLPAIRSSLTLQRSLLSVRKGAVKMPLVCRGLYFCSGKIRLEAANENGDSRKGGFQLIGASSFSIPGQRVVTIRLNRPGRGLFKEKKQLHVRVRISGRAGNDPISLQKFATLKQQD